MPQPKKKPEQGEYIKAFISKLQSSGLGEQEAKKLQYTIITPPEAEALGLPAGWGFKIPYFDIKGAPTKFFRVRYLQDMRNGFAKLTTEKGLRYIQQPDTLNELYIPPLLDWEKVAADTALPIVITEGELKAAAGCKAGVPTIGLGGVWCFKSAKHQLSMLKDWKSYKWRGRKTYIAYDSDVYSNAQVMAAENVLAKELTALGAVVYIVRLPKPDGNGKIGLDDYLLSHSVADLTELLEQSSCYAQASWLHRLNAEVVYIKNPGLILRLDNLQRMSATAFTQHAFSDYIYEETQITDKGSKVVKRKAPVEWLAWPYRSVVEKVTYAPGKERIVDSCLNTWPGWAVKPQRGNIQPWRDLLDFLFKDLPDEKRWFEEWCAYPIQNPGVKMFSSCLFWGLYHGTGKSLVGDTLRAIYGKNSAEISDKDLHSTHNEWAENIQFVVGNEITGGGAEKRNIADRMKGLITQLTMRLNIKYVPSYEIPDCINYYFTSNHPDAFFLEDKDRRYFIHEVRGQKRDDAFYAKYSAWLHNGGAGFLFAHLLDLPIKVFNPKAEAMSTRSKEEMISSVKSHVGTWVEMLREDPNTILRHMNKPIPYKLWSTEDLMALYDPEGKSRTSANGLSRELRKAGFLKVADGMPIQTVVGQNRLWGIRDYDDFRLMRPTAVGKYYDQERALPERKSKFKK